MLCTAVWDAYRKAERSQISDALETLLEPNQPDWSRTGVYAYWDWETHDLLYVGLAEDLPTRFAQHNGLVRHSGGNKQREIDAYFASKGLLGFTILIQSKAVAVWEEIERLDPTLGSTANRVSAVGEGQLIEMHRLVHGVRPPWNKAGGSKDGKRWATAAPALLDVLAARRKSLFVARRTLREIANNVKWRLFEGTIHAARIRAFMDAHNIGLLPDQFENLGSAEHVRLITQSFMLRDGHIVQELDASDDEIRRWVKTLQDPDYWTNEATQYRARIEAMATDPSARESQRKLLNYLDGVIAQAVPSAHLLATREILASGYLDNEPSFN